MKIRQRIQALMHAHDDAKRLLDGVQTIEADSPELAALPAQLRAIQATLCAEFNRAMDRWEAVTRDGTHAEPGEAAPPDTTH